MRRLPRLMFFALILGTGPAMAQDVEFLGTFRDWHAFQFTENGNKVCYMASKPTRHEENNRPRGDIFLLVTHRPAEGTRDVINVVAGYTYAAGSEARAQIGDETFSLFTNADKAWARDPATDQSLVTAMRAGSTMTVRGESDRGTQTVDTYSLLGFTAAHNAIGEACPQ